MYITSAFKKDENLDVIPILIIFSALFFINPLLGILGLIFKLRNNVQNDKLYYGFYALISLYFGLINITRIPEGDFLSYKKMFDSAGSLTFLSYMSKFQQEYFFYVATYVFNKILFGNFKLYVILLTFLQYYLYFISIHKYFKNNGKHILLFAIALTALNLPLFFSSVHLLRQMTALSIFIYYFIEKIVNKNNKWWLIVIAVLIHSSSLLLFLLTFIPTLRYRVRLKSIVIIGFTVVFILLFGTWFINLLHKLTMGISWLNYPIMMFKSLKTLDTTWYHGQDAESIRSSYLKYILLPAIIVYLSGRLQQRYYYLLNFIFAYIIILEIFMFSNLLFMQLRMSFYSRIFSPFAIAILIFVLKKRTNSSISDLGISIFLLYFIAKYAVNYIDTSFGIARLDEILLSSVPMYFNYR